MDRYLFLDDVGIARMEGLTRRAHAAEKHPGNPVMRRDHPVGGHVRQDLRARPDLFCLW